MISRITSVVEMSALVALVATLFVSGERLDNITYVKGTDERCSEPVDCDSQCCAAVPNSSPAKCVHRDDYFLGAIRACVTGPGYTCELSSLQNCYDTVTCTKVVGIACDEDCECDDSMGSSNCTTTTTQHYRYCTEGVAG